MKPINKLLPVIALFVLASCGGKDSVDSIAKKWCNLTAKVKSATSDEEKEKARAARRAYENEVEAKHKSDEAFMNKLKDLTRACDN
ncbi:MAG: hypothetical protein JNM68_15220 [Dinghuibacter sp.]|nr:hypothetical protein [Dinghuibacter sp.]